MLKLLHSGLGVAMASALVIGAATAPAVAQGFKIGKLEGPELILDPAQTPKQFSEAPMLAELVDAGKLPPVHERVPAEPLVLEPLHEIGKYGGTWRRGFIGPSDGENGNRLNASDKLIFFDYSGIHKVPSVAKAWEVSEDGRRVRLFLRKGMKWSDGAPFTADDFVFWFEDIYSNRDIVPTPSADMMINKKHGRLVKIDETTVEFQFDEPYHLFVDILAGSTNIGGGQAARQSNNLSGGAYAPKHYLKQFLPDYSSEAEVNERARNEGFDNWVRMLHAKKDWQLNPELPVLGPWRTVQPINTPTWVMERNPYYWQVDTAGNQLPYIDRVVMTLAENTEVLNLRAIAGEYDIQSRFIDLVKLPVIIENQERSNYTVRLDPALNGSDTVLQLNQSFDGDPEVAKWLTNVDFRRALSLGIDRDQLNETFWLGTGTPGSVIPADIVPQSPGGEWKTKWSTYDPEQANALLDEMGLAEKDDEGFRIRTDNGERLVIQIQAVKAFLDWPKHAEMIAQQWRKIGIFADVREMERNLAMTRVKNNEHHVMVWTNGGSEQLFLFPRHAIPVDPVEAFAGPLYALWFASGGTEGKEPDDPHLRKVYELFSAAGSQKGEELDKTAAEIWKIMVDQQYAIGVVGTSPAVSGVRIASDRLGNIAERVCIAQHCRNEGGAYPTTWFYKD